MLTALSAYLGVLARSTRAGIATGFAQDIFRVRRCRHLAWLRAGRSRVVSPTTGPRPFGRASSVPGLTSTSRVAPIPSWSFDDFREYRIGANTFWSPVSGLNLGLEVIYANVDGRGSGAFRGNSAPKAESASSATSNRFIRLVGKPRWKHRGFSRFGAASESGAGQSRCAAALRTGVPRHPPGGRSRRSASARSPARTGAWPWSGTFMASRRG